MEHRHHLEHSGCGASPTTDTAEVHRESQRPAGRGSLNKTALSATAHCLTGCAIGEVLGMVIGTALRLGNWPTIALSVVLIILYIPGAMEAGLSAALFWGSLVVSLLIAGVIAFPLNRWLIGRGMGHAVLHRYHH